LIRISRHFKDLVPNVIAQLGARLTKRMGEEFFLIQCPDPEAITQIDQAPFIRWNLPMHHAWPCNPKKMEGFIEKAAQALATKFADRDLQGIFMGRLDPSSGRDYYKSLATNLRGRTLALFAESELACNQPEDQDPERPSLFCLVGKEGLYCGVRSPREARGFYPGGTKFISQHAPHTISRAGAKVAEALHYLKLHRPLPAAGAHWLELGACPGGMTSELLERGYRVSAIDRAPLDKRLDGRKGLSFIKADVTRFNPPPKAPYDALLCDMNGDALASLAQVARLSRSLRQGGLVIFTLKTPGATGFAETNLLYQEARRVAAQAGLRLLAATHLTYNRLEFTLFFERRV